MTKQSTTDVMETAQTPQQQVATEGPEDSFPSSPPPAASAAAHAHSVILPNNKTLQHQHSSMEEFNNALSRYILMPVFSHPKQRQRWGDTQLHPHTNWGDIFFDLFYVAAAYNLGNLLREDPTSTGLLYFLGCFWPIFGLWYLKLFYDGRYYVGNDLYHRGFEIAILLALATSILHIRPVSILSNPDNEDMFLFCLGMVIAYVLALTRYVEVWYFAYKGASQLYPEAAIASKRDVVSILCSLAFYIAAMVYAAVKHFAFNGTAAYAAGDPYATSNGNTTTGDNGTDTVPSDGGAVDYPNGTNTTTTGEAHRFLAAAGGEVAVGSTVDNVAVWLLIGGALTTVVVMAFIVMILLSPRVARDPKKISVPMNIDYCIHRVGEWVMLMIGESVLSLLIVDVNGGQAYWRTFFCGVISVVLLQYLHFRTQPHDPDKHAWRRSRNAGFIYSYFFYAYSPALVILGASYKMFLFEYVYEQELTYEGSTRGLVDPSSPLSRFLAGGTSAGLRFAPADRKRRVAILFSGSLAIVWFCLDVFVICHRGIKEQLNRVNTECPKYRWVVIVMILARILLIAFAATVFLYETQPETLALIGLCGQIAQLILRGVGELLFPVTEEEEKHLLEAARLAAIAESDISDDEDEDGDGEDEDTYQPVDKRDD